MQLNLPHHEVALKREASGIKIFDRLRNKYVALTPEEWVRQHFIEFLINDRGFPPSLMGNEVGLTLNSTQRRCDSVLFNARGEAIAIMEYKAPTVSLSQKTFDQIVRYSMVLNAPYLIVSNGMTHYCCEIDYSNHSYRFLKEIPFYRDLKK